MTSATASLRNDFDYYAWRKPILIDGSVAYIVPMSDPTEDEWPFDYMFGTATEAHDAIFAFEVEDIAFDEKWVLFHYTGEIVAIQPLDIDLIP